MASLFSSWIFLVTHSPYSLEFWHSFHLFFLDRILKSSRFTLPFIGLHLCQGSTHLYLTYHWKVVQLLPRSSQNSLLLYCPSNSPTNLCYFLTILSKLQGIDFKFSVSRFKNSSFCKWYESSLPLPFFSKRRGSMMRIMEDSGFLSKGSFKNPIDK